MIEFISFCLTTAGSKRNGHTYDFYEIKICHTRIVFTTLGGLMCKK